METYRSTRPKVGKTFLVTQWRCPNTAKPLSRIAIILGKKPKEGTHPPHKSEVEIGEIEPMAQLSPELREKVKTECKIAGIAIYKFARKYLSFNADSLSAYFSGANLSQARIEEIERAAEKLAAENVAKFGSTPTVRDLLAQEILAANDRQHQEAPELEEAEELVGLVETPAAVLEHAQQLLGEAELIDHPHGWCSECKWPLTEGRFCDRCKAYIVTDPSPKAAEILESLAAVKTEFASAAPSVQATQETWPAPICEDVLDQAVAILRKIPSEERHHVLEILRQYEKLEQLERDFRRRLAAEVVEAF